MPSWTVSVHQVGPLSTNSYLVSDHESQAFLIDPGDDGDYLSEQITRQNLSLSHILLTHGHFDHVLGLLPLHLNFPDADIYLHPADHFIYQQATSSATHWVGQGYSPDPPPPFTSTTSLPSNLELLETPGHTPGSVCFYDRNNNWLFSGDILFQGAVGRTDLSYSSPLKLANSLQRLTNLPGDTIVYPGHGPSTTLSQEIKNLS